MFFNVVRDLFKRYDVLCKSVKILEVSNAERILELRGLRKKYSIRCQILGSRNKINVFSRKMFFSVVRDLFE